MASGTVEVWVREVEDGFRAVGLFNLGTAESRVSANWQASASVAGRVCGIYGDRKTWEASRINLRRNSQPRRAFCKNPTGQRLFHRRIKWIVVGERLA